MQPLKARYGRCAVALVAVQTTCACGYGACRARSMRGEKWKSCRVAKVVAEERNLWFAHVRMTLLMRWGCSGPLCCEMCSGRTSFVGMSTVIPIHSQLSAHHATFMGIVLMISHDYFQVLYM